MSDEEFTVLPPGCEEDAGKYESFLEAQAVKYRENLLVKKRKKLARRVENATALQAEAEVVAEPATKKTKAKKQKSKKKPDRVEPEVVKRKKTKVVVEQPMDSSSDDDEEEERDFAAEKSTGKNDRKQAADDDLRRQMLGARFRLLNEQLYSMPSVEATALFEEHPDLFSVYHDGFAEQVKGWPENPVDHYIAKVNEEASIQGSLVVGDFGCGDGQLGKVFINKKIATIHSFDLVAKFPHIVACDSAKVPLAKSTLDVAVFCLSLMGTNWADFIAEARRTLKKGGELWITEVASRIDDIKQFVASIKSMGFNFTGKDLTNSHFVRFTFTKNPRDPTHAVHYKLGVCKYKKR